MKTLCTICARGGSKRLPGKNIRNWFGIPLIRHSVIQALACEFDYIVASSDDYKILNASGLPKENRHKRRDILSTDIAPKIDVIRDIAKHFPEADLIVDLAVTSPLRLVNDIQEAMRTVIKTNCTSIFLQDFVICSDANNNYERRPVLNGAINIWSRSGLSNNSIVNDDTILFRMPKIRSIDIDTLDDFKLAESIYEKGLHNI